MRLFYANRVRKWQARVNKAEARVNKYDASRQKWQERHNDLQRQVSERYDRELEPYIEQMNDLKTLETSAMQARKDLEAKRSGAVKKLVQLRAQATRKHWWQSTRASIEVKKAEKAIKDIEALIAKADKEVARIRAPLAKAKASADKWELKKKTVAQLMEFPQAAGLGRRTIKRIPTPEQKGVEI
jgi:chromosome segregation ATPase